MASKLRKIEPAAQAIIGNIVFSDTEIWAYWNLPMTIYDFLSANDKAQQLASNSNSFIALMKGRDEAIDCNLIVTNQPLDVDHWEDNYLKMTASQAHRSGFDEFVRNQVELMKQNFSFMDKMVFLGIKLKNRKALDFDAANPFQKGFKDAWEYVKKYTNSIFQIPNNVISDLEIEQAKAIENSYNTIISNGNFSAKRSTTESLALLIKKTLYPAMPVPGIELEDDSKWGRGDMYEDFISDIRPRDNPKYIKINQELDGELRTGYRATLSFKSFPSRMDPPANAPWMYYSILGDDVSGPFDVFSRFTIVPNAIVRKEIDKNKKIRQDGLENALKAGVDPSAELISDMDEVTQLDQFTAQDHQPWIKGTFRMVLTSDNSKQLEADAQKMMQKYGDKSVGIKLVWTTHDQLDLMLEAMPGDRLREKSFVQMGTISMVSASGFNIFNKIGD